MRAITCAALAALMASGVAHAATPQASDQDSQVLGLEAYEPTTLGITHDSDDVRFMDFTLSVKYPLMPNLLFCSEHLPWLHEYKAYLAFTGRWGQYIGTRPSSPVIGKRFNPKLFVRRFLGGKTGCTPPDEKVHTRDYDYIDFGYAHESNGQSIDSRAEYTAAVLDNIRRGDDPAWVNDNISRGWDIVEMTYRRRLFAPPAGGVTTGYLQLKYFLSRGFLQGRAEEYNGARENPEGFNAEGRRRREVNGIALIVKHAFQAGIIGETVRDAKLAAIYDTGYNPAFRHHTIRGEAGAKFFQIPLTLWGQRGYGSDLAQYYKKVTSWGVQLEIGSF